MTKKQSPAEATPAAFKKLIRTSLRAARLRPFEEFEPETIERAILDYEESERLFEAGETAEAWKIFQRGFTTSNDRMKRLFKLAAKR